MRLGRRAGSSFEGDFVDTEAAAAVLQEERQKLIRQLGVLGANEHGDLTGDLEFGDGFADAAATAERTEVLGLVDNITTLLSDVDQALQRVADGTYGICDACGSPIGAERMEFRPTSRYCVECKSKR